MAPHTTTAIRSLEAEDADAVAVLVSDPAVARRLGNTPFDGSAGWRSRLESRDFQRSLALGAFGSSAF